MHLSPATSSAMNAKEKGDRMIERKAATKSHQPTSVKLEPAIGLEPMTC
jgi:hypothetical protein